MKYLFCKDNTGKIDNNEKNRKQCLSFNEDWDWELPGINKWIYFAENKIELFIDNAQRDMLKAGEDIEVDPKDAFHYDFDFRIAEEWELVFDEWYDNNSAIDQLITSRLDNSILGDFCEINSSIIEDATLHNRVEVGPFSHIREGTLLEDSVHIGNYTEIKNSHLGKGTKSGHFSYLGDADIGTNVNIGAGTITCNYDGKKKNKTKILDGAFIGSNSALIAPIKIGKNSVVGAGSALTKNVKNKSLSLTRANQVEIKNYKRK